MKVKFVGLVVKLGNQNYRCCIFGYLYYIPYLLYYINKNQEDIALKKMSPMMEQYLKIKEDHKDHILFFRLGDFYEMFFGDAILASKELELTLTGRDCGLEERAPMCGVPYHSCEIYIKRLIQKGYKVAICEQIDDNTPIKGLVTREVVRVITPGTLIEDSMLDDSQNNFLCCIFVKGDEYGICTADISTGELQVTGKKTNEIQTDLINELTRFSPSEIIFNDEFVTLTSTCAFIKDKLSCICGIVSDKNNDRVHNQNVFNNHFTPDAKKRLLELNNDLLIDVVGTLIDYINSTQKDGARRITTVTYYETGEYLDIDITARRNLELTENLKTKQKHGTLLGVIDKTSTAMGKRFLRKSIEQPLVNIGDITRRHNAVEELYQNDGLRDELVLQLNGFFDIERIITKVLYNTATPRDVKSFGQAIKKLPQIKSLLSQTKSSQLTSINNSIFALEDLCLLIDTAIIDNPAALLKDGGVINDGYSGELDEYRKLKDNVKSYLDDLEKRERESSGIKNLKVSYNRVFGYYIEITRSNLSQVPDHYIRKQTLANCERYITQELKGLEDKILSANDKMLALEAVLFGEIIEKISNQVSLIQSSATAIGYLDFIISLAVVARVNNYVRPTMVTSGEIDIVDGRHPVIEQMMEGGVFIANDTYLDCKAHKAVVITGPNMSGKSTYMRQVAIITILAQMGGFVPAKSASISVCDKVFTRIGASDDLSSGRSTFMVEMDEVAHILKNATNRSLIILDEIGRGTSTFDGMSIARAVIEYITNTKQLSCKTMFATHYHELTDLEQQSDCIKNLSIAVQKNGDDITFLRKIVSGPADDSYGIEVAKLAGVPSKVITRAKEVLAGLEGEAAESDRSVKVRNVKTSHTITTELPQLAMETKANPVIQKLSQTNVDSLTPLEALNLVYQLKKLI